MPQGCDFSCGNQRCLDFGKVIVMHGVWPTKNIDEAIAEAEPDPERKAALESRKAAGRGTALFVYPVDKGACPCGYRLQLYCPSCLVIDDKDCSCDPNEAKSMSDNPPSCPTCGVARFSMRKAVDSGLPCPSCGVPMSQFLWFTK